MKKKWKKPELLKLDINIETQMNNTGTNFDGVVGS